MVSVIAGNCLVDLGVHAYERETMKWLMTIVFLATVACSTSGSDRKQPGDLDSSAAPTSDRTSSQRSSRIECDLASYPAVSITHFIQTDLVQASKPTYPAKAVRDGIEGDVRVAVLVDSRGHVFRSCAIAGAEQLADSAAKAALHLRFKPNPGRKRYVYEIIQYRFALVRRLDTQAKPYILVQPD
jgi:TonB family protein